MAALIEVQRLYRYYGDHCGVHDLSFTLEKGDVLGFLGPNGAGKSTTMQIISGNLAPSAGAVRINGIDILDEPRRAKAAIGYLPETPPLYTELTVDEYLTYCAKLRRVARRHLRKTVESAKERCGLEAASRRLIGNLSKGYRQRVGVAQAILHEPSVVILDEPTVGLDPIQIREIRGLIAEIGQERGVILSTHILPEVQAVCNRIQIIHEGRLVFSDTMAGLQRRSEATSLLTAFGASPSPEALGALPGVVKVEALSEYRYRLHHEPGASPAEALTEVAVTRGWRLRELVPERSSLERIFLELTFSDSTATDEKAA